MITWEGKWFVVLILIIGIISFLIITTVIKNNRYEKYIYDMNSNNHIKVQIKTPINHRILEKQGYDIHYYITENQSDDLIVFLHPAFGDHRCFDQQIDFFSTEYRVLTIDLLGHGLSQPGASKDKIDKSADHIQEILEVEGYDQAHFVGVSMGSLIAQYVALKNLKIVKSVTVLGGYDINSKNKEVMKAQRTEGLKWIFRILFSMKSFRRYVSSTTTIHRDSQARFYDMVRLYTRKSFKVMPGLGNIIKLRNYVKRDFPLLLMTGDHDLDLVRKVSEDWKEIDPGVELHMIPNAGHCANMDNPDVFNSLLADFISKSDLVIDKIA